MATRLGAMFSRTGVADLANKPVGTGPYKLGAWKRGDSIALGTQRRLLGHASRRSTAVTFKYFTDATAMNNALLTGGIDIISDVQTPESLQQFAGNNRLQGDRGHHQRRGGAGVQQRPRAVRTTRRCARPSRYAIDHKAAARHRLGRPRHADRLDGAAHRPVVRGPHRRLPVQRGQGQGAARRQDVRNGQ